MKKTILLSLILFACLTTQAQKKNNFYLDMSLNEVGLSATYDRKILPHLDLGAGVNSFHFYEADIAPMRAAAYLDIRPFWNRKRSLWFVFADIGAAANGGHSPDSTTVTHGSFYFALAAGYCYKINKRGMGPYVTLGMYGYTEIVHRQNVLLTPRDRDYLIFDATSILSIGFKL